MSVTYRWKPGAQVKADPQVAGEILDRVRAEHNDRLTEVDVLREATPRSSPLHNVFDWDNRSAAHAYRLDQARYLIRSLEVVTVDPKGEQEPIRAFVSVVRDEDRSFTSTAHALSDNELRRQVLLSAWRELEALRRKHAGLIEFAKVFAAIEQARPA